ncbi:indolepyruvate ferredoxin oxidoreductase family protein [Sulfitobacter mediterraneus]|uniref:indolepyruvate ferredoxin oxidoreductase family protein n=1 Tax=Sulfitobacter mediterraneus TaxID=83219 RepID=UPI001933C548|nr:indolepyruvate ferredoxin oxidoreductase family protein [Sulfitobacter mediterraneus]MBM1310283.1 indolepyruvate ferredoxin oxidoreductase family protein [Sulfitobacter mediterraneus]MBM1314167.1 indolepyruvate ferredoxin oxidoreductase family protein [Sulfitobacter mediterraneus]MBM1322527.1 indolepyruvate ferredoxin oxidoreductase family protein [Sulfitobacter mediterraneus]MBM1326439.1 indolepyruvate ferredoxin oxidoreductase family protein [Sulfitobacter mediterraneus]MBM1397785.1 indol
MSRPDHQFNTYQLDDRYAQVRGRVFMTGTQALTRIMLDQARRDRDAGMNTAGFVSGYRGSPLGGLDQEMWRIAPRLEESRIKFMPAVNEDLGATAVLGAQQAHLDPHAEVDGVFSMWYGKGPGVDRSGDALKHGNAYGSAPKGGVLVVAGDDHGCVSSSMPHQSDVAFMSWFMPTLNPASVAEYQSFGEYGFALSRFSGTWVGFKAISETVESGASVGLLPDRTFNQPDYTAPAGGLHVRLGDLPSPGIETRIHDKLEAVEAFVKANPIDRKIYDIDDAPFGIVSTGKGHLDLLEALRLLGLSEEKCRQLGIDIYKVGMVWPLARRDALEFVKGKKEVLVIEEKRGIIESQFKEAFYDWPGSKPQRMVGKHDENLKELVPWTGELSPLKLVPIIAARLDAFFPSEKLVERAEMLTSTPVPVLNVPGANRTPYFCSGCPHNTSTKLPEGSKAASGIGCHVMASWMDRDTAGFAQMGGEGVPWIATSLFNGGKHIFQNLGEGTWYHSGSLAIRQAVAAKANITYKILYNDAVAMTGGQPVDGPVSVSGIAQAARAEGVNRIALVSDHPEKFTRADFPAGTSFDHRRDLDTVQRELREIPGVTVLIYEQTCATEKRRKRKRGQMDDPKRFVMINDLVCEGCGDCSLESNCLSVEPKKTEFGTKRKINQSTCNKDYSCLNGFCPSFVTIEGGERRKKSGAGLDVDSMVADLPRPKLPNLEKPFDLLVTGVGGTGVVTVGALISMAAHLEGKGASVLDFTGFAQKFGTVLGYVRLAESPDAVHQVRIDDGSADAVIGCDMVVSSAPKASAHYRKGTRIVLNRAEMPTGDLVLNRDADLRIDAREDVITGVVGAENLSAFDANAMAERLMGDAVFANVMMLGFAWQKGLVPVSLDALYQAIELNGVAPDKNKTAFAYGRIMADNPELLTQDEKAPTTDESVSALIARRMAFLTDYQNAAYATRYQSKLESFAQTGASEDMIRAAAKSLFKLMAYKDEYEVARLHAHAGFTDQIAQDFEGDYKVKYHLAPPLWPTGKDTRGRPFKKTFGPWMGKTFGLLARMKGLRGTWADVFRYGADRKLEVALIGWYEEVMAQVGNGALNEEAALAVLIAPMEIRGYGPVKEKAAAQAKEKVATLLG